jgi:hypothetical protein
MPDLPIQPRKAWTLLVFMAGDNDLDRFGRLDLMEMERLPSDEQLHVVVQFDGREQAAYRFRFFPGGHEQVGEPLGEINAGDPASLTEFVRWGLQRFPAERTALVIWSHGTGLRDLPADFDYSSLRSGEAQTVKDELKRTLFRPTLEALARSRRRLRAIAVDATDRDFLDNQELQKALADLPGTGPRVDLLGFDACLMNVLEIGYQLRGLARYIVGSQEVMPGTGWPYLMLLSMLADQPAMSARKLAETVVALYPIMADPSILRGAGAAYTHSALDMGQMAQTFDLVGELARTLARPEVFQNTKVQMALRRARDGVKRFHDRDVADLLDWCQIVRRETKGRAGAPFRSTLLALQEHLEPGRGVVVANQARGGDDLDRIHGLSIYWPQDSYSPVYDSLDFAASGWGTLVQQAIDLFS